MLASSEETDSWIHYLGLALGLHKLQLSVEWEESWGLSRDSVIFLKHRFSPELACKKQCGTCLRVWGPGPVRALHKMRAFCGHPATARGLLGSSPR